MLRSIALALASSLWAGTALGAGPDLYAQVKHGYATNGGVRIHYAELGSGPAVVFIHGFPDFWYTWRHQMTRLAEAGYRTVAIDQRGYNLSDKPDGVAAYAMANLVGDVVAVIHSLGVEKAIVVGHDWGGVVAWRVAIDAPEVVDKLIILNLPHPNGLARELATNPEQQKNSAYARTFQSKSALDPDVFFGMPMNPETMSSWVGDPAARQRYVEAFQRTNLEATLNYYKANYPREPYAAAWQALQDRPLPAVKAPVLQFHGLKDTALNARGLDGTWGWLEQDWTLVTVPSADHFVQQDAAELVSETMKWWLAMRRSE